MTSRHSLVAGLTGGVVLLAAATGCGWNRSTTSTASTAKARPPTSTTSSARVPLTAVPTTVASPPGDPGYAPGVQRISLDVHGTRRTAVLRVPADLHAPAPLVFAFHGHGGSGTAFDRKMDVEGLWPDAIVVYPDGLVGHAGRTDPQGVRTGWQTRPGEAGDADVAFYDALRADLVSKLSVDQDRVYLMGHSNGSAFVSLLLDVRGGGVAATANLSAQPGQYLRTDPTRSMFMSMGRTDPIVPYANQHRSVPVAEQKLGVDPSTVTVDGYLTIGHGRGNLELDVYDYPGGHEPPTEVPGLVVAFFRRHTLSDELGSRH